MPCDSILGQGMFSPYGAMRSLLGHTLHIPGRVAAFLPKGKLSPYGGMQCLVGRLKLGMSLAIGLGHANDMRICAPLCTSICCAHLRSTCPALLSRKGAICVTSETRSVHVSSPRLWRPRFLVGPRAIMKNCAPPRFLACMLVLVRHAGRTEEYLAV